MRIRLLLIIAMMCGLEFKLCISAACVHIDKYGRWSDTDIAQLMAMRFQGEFDMDIDVACNRKKALYIYNAIERYKTKLLEANQRESSTLAMLLRGNRDCQVDEKEWSEELLMGGVRRELHVEKALYKELLELVKADNVEMVSQLIANGYPVNFRGGYKTGEQPLLRVAAQYNCTKVTPLLIAAGADISARGHRLEDPLAVATIKGDVEMVKLLLAAGAALISDISGVLPSALDIWTRYDYLGVESGKHTWKTRNPIDVNVLERIVHMLILCDADCDDIDVEKISEQFRKPLLDARACKSQIIQEVGEQNWSLQDLIQSRQLDRCLPNMPDLQDMVVSWNACDDVVQDVIDIDRQRRLWVSQGVRVNMHWAEWCAHKMHISNVQEVAGQEKFELALWSKDMHKIQEAVLDPRTGGIKQGVDIDAHTVGKNGATALEFAVERSLDNVIKFLLEHQADVNAVDCADSTALHKAVEWWENQSMVRLLVDGKANVNGRDEYGKTPLMQLVLALFDRKNKQKNKKIDAQVTAMANMMIKAGADCCVETVAEGRRINLIEHLDGKYPQLAQLLSRSDRSGAFTREEDDCMFDRDTGD